MKDKFIVFFIIYTIFNFKSTAQTFYVSSPKNPMNITTGSNLYKITLTANGVLSELVSNCSPNDQFFSIAMNKSGFYWLKSPYLYKAEMNGNSLVNCNMLTNAAGFSSALTIGPDQKAYYVTNNLYATDLNTLQTVNLGSMRYFPTGDMCFFNGILYMAAREGIIKVDIADPSKSTLHFPISQSLSMFGLVSVATSLHKNTVYGLIYVNDSKTDIIELDLENKQIIGIVGSLPYGILDAASPVEDGSITGIQLDKIEMSQDCSGPDKAIVQILTKPHLEEFTYTLNGQTNTTGKFTGIAPGVYTVNITSVSDQLAETITIGNYDLIKPQYSWLKKNEMCGIPGEITFTSPVSNSSYQIRYGTGLFAMNHTFNGLNAGSTYHFEIINANGCKVDEKDISISKDICKIELDEIQIQQQCDAYHKGVIKALTKPHTAIYTYTLNETTTNSTGIFENLTPGQYSLKITSPEDVLEIPSIEVPDYKLTQPSITYLKNNPSCSVKGDIKFNTTGSTLYKIKYKTTTVPFDHLFDNLDPSLHHFVILSETGCLIDEFDIELVYQPCAIEITQTAVSAECNILSKGIITITCPPIPETYTYTLNNGMTNNTGIFNMLDPGTYEVNVSASGGGISQSRQIIVPDYRQLHPLITSNRNNPSCNLKGDIKFNIAANSNLFQIKYKGNIVPFDHLFNNLDPGTHHFIILSDAGCLVDEYDIELVYQPCNVEITKIEVTAECDVLRKGLVHIVCPPIPETYTYTLNNGITNNTGIFTMLDPGTYEVNVSASGGGVPQSRQIIVPDYSLDKPLTITNKTNPECDLPGQLYFTIKTNPQLYSIRYNNSIYPANHIFKNLFAGNYHFSILKKDGCIVDAFNVTMVQEECSDVAFPNAFSPNGDGINDVFRANSNSKASNFNIQIYDRRGVLIKSSTELHNCWNGDHKGTPLPAATYYWIATFTSQRNMPIVQKGSLTLIR